VGRWVGRPYAANTPQKQRNDPSAPTKPHPPPPPNPSDVRIHVERQAACAVERRAAVCELKAQHQRTRIFGARSQVALQVRVETARPRAVFGNSLRGKLLWALKKKRKDAERSHRSQACQQERRPDIGDWVGGGGGGGGWWGGGGGGVGWGGGGVGGVGVGGGGGGGGGGVGER